jgi:hypothetical protein
MEFEKWLLLLIFFKRLSTTYMYNLPYKFFFSPPRLTLLLINMPLSWKKMTLISTSRNFLKIW